jgi:hypothetical protein
MQKILPILLMLVFGNNAWSQNRLQIVKIEQRAKEGNFDVAQAKIKCLAGSIKYRDQWVLMKDNVPLSLIRTDNNDEIKPGQTIKYAEVVYCLGQPLADGQSFVFLAEMKKPVKAQSFSFKTDYAFLGNSNTDFFATLKDFKGQIAVGDALEYKNDKGQVGRANVQKIDLEGFVLPFLTEYLANAGSVNLTIKAETEIDFSKATAKSANPNTKIEEVKTANATKINLNTIPVNLSLGNRDFSIAIHNLHKYKPDPASKASDIIKIDYDLDYYFVDCTVKNLSNKVLDAGELMLRFNFYDANGTSADEALRVFKTTDSETNETKKQAGAIDKLSLGGTSKIKTAAVLAKYTAASPDWDRQQKANYNAINTNIAPGGSVSCMAGTVLAMPKGFGPVALGTWQGVLFQKKNLISVDLGQKVKF